MPCIHVSVETVFYKLFGLTVVLCTLARSTKNLNILLLFRYRW
uniref:Uncharacterized protein n=1 Tax=Triticum urartu TaxID=4572 RepID=A0A8R7QRD2_TRIUA